MNVWRCGLMAVAAGGIFLATGGCDDSPPVPATLLEQAATQAKTSPRPTTQELLTGARTNTLLVPLPLKMQVPTSWKTKSLRVMLLEGPTPTSDISIQLSTRPSIRTEDFDRLVAGAKKELQQSPDTVKKADVRPLPGSGNGKLLERQMVGTPGPYTVYDAQNNPHVSTQSIYKWTLTAFVPFENAYQVYELNFIGLTKEQYEKDKEFLNSIVSTLTLATPGEAGGIPPAATTAPTPAPPPSALP